jgi:hypothetical protein
MQLDLSPIIEELKVSVVEELRKVNSESDGYLNCQGSADYLGCDVGRIYDLKSLGKLVPDGFDGKKPLFTRETLDAYVRGEAG